MELPCRFELLVVRCRWRQPTPVAIEYALRAEVGSSCASYIAGKYKKPHPKMWFDGAVEQIRTADLVITNDVLCLLSYNSENGDRERARTVDL